MLSTYAECGKDVGGHLNNAEIDAQSFTSESSLQVLGHRVDATGDVDGHKHEAQQL